MKCFISPVEFRKEDYNVYHCEKLMQEAPDHPSKEGANGKEGEIKEGVKKEEQNKDGGKKEGKKNKSAGGKDKSDDTRYVHV